MTISESQRRTLDLMAESAGLSWADVEELAQQMYRTTVSGLTKGQANKVMQALAAPAACTAPATPSARHSTAQRRFRRGRMDVWAGCMASGDSGRWPVVFHQLFSAPVKLSAKHHDCLPFCRTSAAGQPADHAGPELPQNVPG